LRGGSCWTRLGSWRKEERTTKEYEERESHSENQNNSLSFLDQYNFCDFKKTLKTENLEQHVIPKS
jgi:hypothetical protein